ncbi:MAG: hypothetical protein ABEI99_07545 [Halobaculum sp.]
MPQQIAAARRTDRGELPFGVTHEVVGSTVLQDLTGWDGETDGLDAVESAWMEVASQSDVTAAVTEFSTEMLLGAETQDHLAVEWSANADAAGIERIAFVSDGIKARAVSANLDVAQDVQTFTCPEAALGWANEV